MIYVLMRENPYSEGNYPIAVVNDFGKRKIQEMEFKNRCNHLRGVLDYAKQRLNQYYDSIKGFESVPEIQETLAKYRKEIEQKGLEYRKFLENKDEYFNSDNGVGCLNFGTLVLHPFEISGYEIGEEIYEEDYTKEIEI